jgi:hypothetical protein
MRSRLMAAAVTAFLLLTAALAGGHPPKGAPRCKVFPRDNPWNQRVDGLPVASDSARLVRSIGLDASVHADFGAGLYEGRPIGIPFTTVGGRQRKVHVSFEYADESDRRRYAIPRKAPVEGGRASDGDRHVIVVDRKGCRLYELYAAYPVRRGRSWRAGSGAIWSLRSNRMRKATYTSADAAGLPILPGLARWDEVKRGRINHALRFTVPETRREYIYPARHFASDSNDPDLPAMGQRFRLKANYPIDGFPRQARVVLAALKRYGMIVADNGSGWFITGAPDPRWDDARLEQLKRVPGTAFEAVRSGPLTRG